MGHKLHGTFAVGHRTGLCYQRPPGTNQPGSFQNLEKKPPNPANLEITVTLLIFQVKYVLKYLGLCTHRDLFIPGAFGAIFLLLDTP